LRRKRWDRIGCMNERAVAPAERLLRTAAVALSVFFVLLFLYVSFKRLRYPFELDRIESGMMTSVWRLRQGYPLYTAPGLTWVPFLYAPLFFYLSAALSKVMGLSYAPLRMVSILSTLGTLGAIGTMVWKETGRLAAAIVAIGLFASLYLFVLGWFDVGRVDSLSVFLFLLAVLATRRAHPLVAAVFWLLAFQSKQTFLPLGLAVFVVEWQRPRRMLMGMVAFGAMAWGSVAWLNHVTNHWYSFYAFGTPIGLRWDPRVAAMFPMADLLAPWPIAAVLILAAAVLTPMHWRKREGSFFAIVTALLVGAVWFVRAHVGANVNAVLPLYAWIAILTGVAMHRLLTLWETRSESETVPQVWTAPALLWLALTVQLAAHMYRPGELVPAAGELAVRQDFLSSLRATPGDVWLANHSYDGILAGKPMHAEMDAYDAVLGRPYAPAVAEFDRQIAAQQFSAVVLDAAPAAYAPVGIFTSAPFADVYRARSEVIGTGSRDHLRFVLFPCDFNGPQEGLLDTRLGFVDRSLCPR
jgi:hypothetical protein